MNSYPQGSIGIGSMGLEYVGGGVARTLKTKWVDDLCISIKEIAINLHYLLLQCFGRTQCMVYVSTWMLMLLMPNVAKYTIHGSFGKYI